MELHATHVAGEVGLAVNADPTEAMDTGMARGCATGQTRLRQIFRRSRSHHRDPAMHCPVSSGQWKEDRIGVRPRGPSIVPVPLASGFFTRGDHGPAVAPRQSTGSRTPAITEASPRANQGPHRAWKGCPGSRPWGKAGAPLQTPGPMQSSKASSQRLSASKPRIWAVNATLADADNSGLSVDAHCAPQTHGSDASTYFFFSQFGQGT